MNTWREKIDADKSTPRQLWSFINALLGRGQVPTVSSLLLWQGRRCPISDGRRPAIVVLAMLCWRFFLSVPVRDHRRSRCGSSCVAWQKLCTWSSADRTARSRYRRHCSVSDRLVQQIYDDWDRPWSSQDSVHHAAREEVGHGFWRRAVVPSNVQVVGRVQATRAARDTAATGIPEQVRPAATAPAAYRAGHSTETAVLKVLSDILLAIDAGNLSALVLLLDLSAAFDTVDPNILTQRLKTSYGLSVMVL